MEGALGILPLDGTEELFAIDGQHRVAGIEEAIAENPGLGEEEVCVVLVAGVLSDFREEDPEGFERTRRLFTTLNRYAKPVSKMEIIALDEDDVVAIVTRRLVEEYPLFRGKGASPGGCPTALEATSCAPYGVLVPVPARGDQLPRA